MALYDVRANKKITEDFHFDINEEHARNIVQSIRRNSEDEQASISDLPDNWLMFPKQVQLFFLPSEMDSFMDFKKNYRPCSAYAIAIVIFSWLLELKLSFKGR